MKAEHDQEIRISPELAKDQNYVAYKAQEASLKESHMGEWAAFVDGNVVAIEKDKRRLFEYLSKHYPQSGAFFHQIVEVEEVAHLGGAGFQILD